MSDRNPVLTPKLYYELASWFPLLTPPEHYAEEADTYRRIADPGDDRYQVDFAYLLREGAEARAEHDHHVLGLFSRGEWERLIREAGLDCFVEPYEHNQAPAGSCGIFIGRKV